MWKATVESIMKKIEQARAKLEAIKPGCTQPRRKKAVQYYVQLFRIHYTTLDLTNEIAGSFHFRRIAQGRIAKRAGVLAAELGRAIVADSKG